MAEPFQPRFVDLVRNYTNTSGTGNFAVESAVKGFSSFSDVLQPGEQFYYSVAGSETSGETEVGRGTMQADGSISRDPISGVPTDFSTGTKIIALVAAAEWFSQVSARSAEPVDGDRGDISVAGGVWSIDADAAAIANKAQQVADRAALASASTSAPVAYLHESGREGMFVWNSADLSARIAADTAQGLYAAPSSDPTGASGAWVRRFHGNIHCEWFGSDGSAVVAAVAMAQTLSGSNITGYGSSCPTVELPFTTSAINMTQTLTLTKPIEIRGRGSTYTIPGTVLKWPAGMTGIDVQASDCVLANFGLIGGWANGSTIEGPYHGINLHRAGDLRSLYVQRWQGDGIHADESVPTGNDNCFYIERCTISDCRIGLYLHGSDSNAGATIDLICNSNRQAGIWDESFLGNGHYSPHTSTNGIVNVGANGVPYVACSYGGNIYCCIYGQESGAATNAPTGTTGDNNWWRYWKAGGPNSYAPAWVSGTQAFRVGGGFIIQSAAGGVYRPYTEGDEPPPQTGTYVVTYSPFGWPGDDNSKWIGATSAHSNITINGGAYIRNSCTLELKPGQGLTVDGSAKSADANLYMRTGTTSSYIGWKDNAGSLVAQLQYNSSSQVFNWQTKQANGYFNFMPGSGSTSAVQIKTTGLELPAGKVLSVSGATAIDASRNGSFASLTATGTIAGANLSGTNSGDETKSTIDLKLGVDGTSTNLWYRKDGTWAAPTASAAWGSITGTLSTQADLQTALAAKANLSGAAFTGSISASNLSGTNSGDQTITLTGDVTGSGTGSFPATITNGAVSFTKIQNVSGSGILVGRATTGVGSVEEIAIGPQLLLTGSTLGLASDLTLSNVTVTGTAIVQTLLSTVAGIGYANGAGGTVAQATSKSTGVTLNRPSGQITMNAAALAASTTVSFTLTNSVIGSGDVLVLNHISGGTAGSYALNAQCGAGTATISVRNVTSASLSQAIVIAFAVVKAATS